MLLTSGIYFAFLILVFFAYWLIADRKPWRIAFLAAAGCIFYAHSGLWPLLLFAAMAAVDFATTRLMSDCRSARKRRLLLAVSLFVDVGALCLFKYANFFIGSIHDLFAHFGLDIGARYLEIIAPLGISFFVFQSVGYVIDVYRKDAEPANNYLEYLSFVLFFPTIVAGPILRAKQILPQLRGRLALDSDLGGQALFLIALGLIKKFAIADYLSANFVDRVFDFPERFSSLEVLTAVYGYALQIYMDFSGYSDIAIGSAMLLGFTLPENFNSPYRSRNLPEFWRRWHISLSTWLRDYVFFSIAGPRARNSAALYAGLIATMLIGGLWHGATWTFVLWGLMHGLGLAAYRAFEFLRARMKARKRADAGIWSKAVCVFLTFHFICLTWIFFRAETVDQAIGVLSQIFSFTIDRSNLPASILIVMAIGFASHWLPDGSFESIKRVFMRLPAFSQALLLFCLGIGLYFVASTDVAPFIYAKF